MKHSKIRLYVNQSLAQGQTLILEKNQSHYLFNVMRLEIGDTLSIFNETAGEFRAQVVERSKRNGALMCMALERPVVVPPDLWLCFAPIKKARTDFIVEKAAEMGVTTIQPIQTDFTNSERIKQDRLQAHVIEAVEQCGGIFVPQVKPLVRLDQLLQDWPADRNIMYCDETQAGANRKLVDREHHGSKSKWAIFVGPEGGFSPLEQQNISGRDNVYPVSLGPRILRADTAVVAAITIWQVNLGDW